MKLEWRDLKKGYYQKAQASIGLTYICVKRSGGWEANVYDGRNEKRIIENTDLRTAKRLCQEHEDKKSPRLMPRQNETHEVL